MHDSCEFLPRQPRLGLLDITLSCCLLAQQGFTVQRAGERMFTSLLFLCHELAFLHLVKIY